MMVVVAYDVSTETPEGKRRLRLVAKTCMKYGQRVQNSVFECSVSPSDYLVLVHDLLKIANIDEDSLRFYKLGSRYADRIERYGRVVPEKLRTLDHGRPWSDDQFASTRLSSNRDMSR